MKAFYATQGGGTAYFDREKREWLFQEVPDWLTGYLTGDPVPEEWGIGGCVGHDKETEVESAWEEHSFSDKDYEEDRAWTEHENL